MSNERNIHAASSRVMVFFCTNCRVDQEPEDRGEVFPTCPNCGTRSLEKRWQDFESEAPKVREADVPKDERPEQAAPRTQQPFTRRMKTRRDTILELLRFLITEPALATESEEVSYALFQIFNSFLRGIVNVMVIERADWRAAVRYLETKDKAFCLRYGAQLEEFKTWAENPDGVPTFIEPETNSPHGKKPLAEETPT